MANARIEEAKRILKIADHMVYITYPAINEKRLLIKIVSQVGGAMNNVVLSVLENEYLNKRISSYANPKMNFKSFVESSKRYGIKQSGIDTMEKIASLIEMHEQSPMEFVRNDRFVIMTDSMHTEEITYNLVKSFLATAKEAVSATENRLKLDSTQMH